MAPSDPTAIPNPGLIWAASAGPPSPLDPLRFKVPAIVATVPLAREEAGPHDVGGMAERAGATGAGGVGHEPRMIAPAVRAASSAMMMSAKASRDDHVIGARQVVSMVSPAMRASQAGRWRTECTRASASA